MRGLIVAGTDTGIGKTILSALLMSVLPKAVYWKPIQSGPFEETDSETVVRISGVSPERILPEAYRLQQPLSPHRSAALDGVTIQTEKLKLPQTQSFLIAELAGGILVPLRKDLLQIEIVHTWGLPVLLATRSTLGTINHTLLTLEALRAREINIFGAICIGPVNTPNEEAIEHFGHIEVLGRIPLLQQIDRTSLRHTFNTECRTLRNILKGHAEIDD